MYDIGLYVCVVYDIGLYGPVWLSRRLRIPITSNLIAAHRVFITARIIIADTWWAFKIPMKLNLYSAVTTFFEVRAIWRICIIVYIRTLAYICMFARTELYVGTHSETFFLRVSSQGFRIRKPIIAVAWGHVAMDVDRFHKIFCMYLACLKLQTM